MPTDSVYACLVVDDYPLNATYWWRIQATAVGYQAPNTGGFGRNWQLQEQAPFLTPALTAQFADLCEEFGVRGKFTVLACPGGLGRLDQSVRQMKDGDLRACLDVVRRRLAPRFDLTPEVCTHTLALDLASGGLLPHTETGWLSYLASAGRHEELRAYVRHAWSILENVGLHPAGTTVGGIPDISNVAGGKLLTNGDCRQELAAVVLSVRREFQPGAKVAFQFTGSGPWSPAGLARGVPETLYAAPDGGQVFEIYTTEDQLLELIRAEGEAEAHASRWITPDLKGGELVAQIEAGRVAMLLCHTQTLSSLNTGKGLACMREIIRRLHARYGQRLTWCTPTELWQAVGEKSLPPVPKPS